MVMEAMANGVIPVCVDVGGISDHIIDGVNGFLIEDDLDENKILAGFMSFFSNLMSLNDEDLGNISNNCYNYAKKHFSKSNFEKSYHDIFPT